MQSKRGTLTGLRKSPQGVEDYDSLLERQYMVELEHDPAVAQWTKKHNVVIPYKLLGFPHHYYPDFLVTYRNGSKELHETKGLPLLFWLSTKTKRQTAEEYCQTLGWKYKIVTRLRR